jgi:hypothetical protein
MGDGDDAEMIRLVFPAVCLFWMETVHLRLVVESQRLFGGRKL